MLLNLLNKMSEMKTKYQDDYLEFEFTYLNEKVLAHSSLKIFQTIP